MCRRIADAVFSTFAAFGSQKEGWMKTEEKANEYLPLRDVVFNTLRESILTGEMKPGERLMEIHLANRLGVSRTPIREAIRMLELEGLVTMIPRRGAEVAQITEKGLRDVLEVRQALDALSIELTCERITEEEIRELRRACDTFVQMTRTQDAVRIAQADVALHDIIVRASGNDRLIQMVGNLSQQMYRYRLEYIKDDDKRKILVLEHEKILKTVRERKVAEAKEAVREHIDNQEITVARNITEKENA